MLAFSIDYYGIFFGATQSVELFCTYCQGSNLASAMRYAVPEYDPEQCQWEPRPVSGVEPQDDHNSPRV